MRPTDILKDEHKAIKAMLRIAASVCRRLEKGESVPAAARFVENARGYAALLSQHIDKEDNILYRIADARLSPEKQSELERAFERVEEAVIGKGRHEEFHAVIEKLENAYLRES
jgi:hemerythrin-like domain-containing protein